MIVVFFFFVLSQETRRCMYLYCIKVKEGKRKVKGRGEKGWAKYFWYVLLLCGIF